MEYGARPLRSTRRLANKMGTRPGWYSITNAATAGLPTQVSIYDEIGFFGVAAGEFMADLKGVNGDIELHINSPGGDVHDGLAIYNQLKQRSGDIHVIIDGLAASAASFIAMAASPGQLQVAPHAQMMVHNGFSMAIGDAADLRKTADLLDMITGEIASIYAERSGKPVDFWLGQMAAETWYTDKAAVEAGLADSIHGQAPARAAWDLTVYSTAPGVSDATPPGPPGVQCPACKKLNKPGAEKCASCGKPLPDPDADDDGPAVADRADAAVTAAADKNNGYVMRDGKWVFDPDGDGDNDGTAAGDTDHEYWSADGQQLKPIPPDPDGKQGKPLAPGQKGNRAQEPVSAQFPALMVAVDDSDWDAAKAWSAGADADDPAAFYAAICAGRKAGDPKTQAAWALPYKYAPSSPPNAAGVKAALGRLSQTQGLTNADAAKDKLQDLMKQINPDYEPSARIDPVLLRSMIAMPAAKVDESPWEPDVAMEAAAASDDPAAYFEAICAGHCPGSPQAKDAWALPYRYSPASAPNATGVRQALARLNQTKHLTNSVQAREILENAMRQVSTSADPDDHIDPDLLGAAFAIGLEGSHR